MICINNCDVVIDCIDDDLRVPIVSLPTISQDFSILNLGLTSSLELFKVLYAPEPFMS